MNGKSYAIKAAQNHKRINYVDKCCQIILKHSKDQFQKIIRLSDVQSFSNIFLLVTFIDIIQSTILTSRSSLLR